MQLSVNFGVDHGFLKENSLGTLCLMVLKQKQKSNSVRLTRNFHIR